MFMNNKWYRVYMSLVESRQDNLPEGYTENHHIIPKSMGGSDSADNLVRLTAREHFVAHRLLSKCTEGDANFRMMWALHRMMYAGHYDIGSRVYSKARIRHSQFLKDNHPAHRIDGWNEKMSRLVTQSWVGADERRKKWSESMAKKQAEWRQDPNYFAEQKRRAAAGGRASAEVVSARVEYNGVDYVGWDSLKSATGITPHLYKKYYKYGIDPIFRVGKDGNMSVDEVEMVVDQFMMAMNQNERNDLLLAGDEGKKQVIMRMVAIGLLSLSQAKKYYEKNNFTFS